MINCNDLKALFIAICKEVEEVSGYVHFFFHYTFHDLHHYRNMDQYLEDLRNYFRLEYSEYWMLKMGIYLHDIGLFLNPRCWHEFKIQKDELLLYTKEDPVEALKNNPLVKALLKKYSNKHSLSFEEAFFNEEGFLSFPSFLRNKAWDELDFVEKAGIREVMRLLHPQIGGSAVGQRFIPKCKRIAEVIGNIISLHEGKVKTEIFKNIGKVEISESYVDQKKLVALLILLDSLDCSGQSRASEEALNEIIEEIRIIEDKTIEIENQYDKNIRSHGHLPHWIFKKHIKEVKIKNNEVTIICDTSSPAYIAGILFFEIPINVWQKYMLANNILKEYGIAFDLFVQVPKTSSYSNVELIRIEEGLMKLGSEFCKQESELPMLKEKYGDRKFTLPRVLALLLSYPYGKYELKANQLASEYICNLLDSELSSIQRVQLKQIFRCNI
jgi:hypothetical protein